MSVLAATSAATITAGGPREYIPRKYVNTMTDQFTDGEDYRFAQCVLRRVPIERVFQFLDEFWVHGHVYLQQAYDSGSWQTPEVFINLRGLSDDPAQTSSYIVNTYAIEDYEIRQCRPIDSQNQGTQAASGRNANQDGELDLSSTDQTISPQFGEADDAAPGGLNAPVNNIFNQVVEIQVQNQDYSNIVRSDSPLTLACCRLYPVPQRVVVQRYKRYGIPAQLTPTQEIFNALTNRDQAKVGEFISITP